jgi:hypothetical protein
MPHLNLTRKTPFEFTDPEIGKTLDSGPKD